MVETNALELQQALQYLVHSQKELVFILLLLFFIASSFVIFSKGIGQQMKWSVRDESLHSKMGCQLFRHMCQEDNHLLEDCKKDVTNAAEAMLKAEERYIDKMFEQGDIENLKANDLKQFIRKDLMKSSLNLVTSTSGSTLISMKKQQETLIGSTILQVVIPILTFFAVRPTDYSKAMKEKILKIFGNEKVS